MKNLFFKILLPILLALLLIIFFFPVPQKDFNELYEGDEAVKNAFNNFRQMPLKQLEVEGLEWSYLSVGEGGSALLFLHGMGGAYDIWWQQIEALKNQFRIISISLPAVSSLDATAKGLMAIMDEENISKVNIIGSSMGGYIAQYMVNTHPERIGMAVFGNTFPPNDILINEYAGMQKAFPFFPEWYLMRTFRESVADRIMPTSENSELLRAYLLEQYYGGMTKQQLGGRLDIVLEFFELQSGADQAAIPKLIIESDNDPLVRPELQEQLKTTYPAAQVHTFQGKGHFPSVNDPDNYSFVLRNFLSEE